MRYRLHHERLRRELARRRISQNRWAQMLGIGKSHLSMMVNGQRPYPSADTRAKLLEGLGLRFEELFVEEAHDSSPRERNLMDSLLQDVIQAWRSLRRRPAFASVIVLTLALGIGATTVIYSVVDASLLRPLPFADADRLVRVYGVSPERGFTRGALSMANVIDWRERSTSFDGLATFRARSFNLVGAGEPERVVALLAADGFLSMLDLLPTLGRDFRVEEYRTGAERVVLISDSLWIRRFDRDPTVIGRAVRIDTAEHVIVGVLPPEFESVSLPLGFRDALPDVVVPLEMEPGVDRSAYWQLGLGKLRAGVSLATAQAEISEIAAQIELEYPDEVSGHQVLLVPLQETVAGDLQPTLLMFLAAVSAVLLVACVNAANLMIAYASSRRREIAMRKALGAGRLRIIRLTLAECLMLAGAGGLIGVAMAGVGIGALRPLLPLSILRVEQVALDLRVAAFAAALSLATALLFGTLPSIRTAATSAREQLISGTVGGDSPGRLRLLRGLVVAQVALAGTLAIGTGLAARSYSDTLAVDPGYHTEGLLSFYTIPRYSYDTADERNEFVTSLLRRLEAVPGVESVGEINFLPFTDNEAQFGIEIEGSPAPEGVGQWGQARAVDDGFFRTLGVSLLQGRDFERADMAGADVAVINETMARRYWPDRDPLGQRFMLFSTDTWYRVIGVAPDLTWHEMREERLPRFYIPYVDDPLSTRGFLLRTQGDPLALAGSVREAVYALNANQSVFDIQSLSDRVLASVAGLRFSLLALLAFAASALALATVGTYAVLSYSVSRRTSEIGIRMALGAQAGQVRSLMIRQSTILALVGVGIAALVSQLLAGWASSLLVGVSTFDPLVLVGVAAVLVLAAVIAAWAPARRAALIDPASALRD